MRKRWDIFCRVVDNYGDIGVAWRLARMLAAEHALEVRLWLDDLAALARIWPGVATNVRAQRVSGVELQAWVAPFPAAAPADVVIEMFQCEIPVAYVLAMAARPSPPCWINLDYLSAERWVADCHRLPSPHPRLPLTKYFYFPGFDPATGGLLREQGLDAARIAFLRDPRVLQRYWARHGLDVPQGDELRVSIFCYPGAPVAELFDHWSKGRTRITALMPEGAAAERVRATLGPIDAPHGWTTRGQARLKVVPFTDQVEFDHLLWACDINFVRGEDSFVRAQWAQRPFVWNIYPQDENTHWIKLHAFLDRYTAGMDPVLANAIRRFWRVWNGMASCAELREAWGAYLLHREAIARHTTRWAEQLADQGELAAGLVKFCAGIGQYLVPDEPGS